MRFDLQPLTHIGNEDVQRTQLLSKQVSSITPVWRLRTTTFRCSKNPHSAATKQLVAHSLNSYSDTVKHLLILFINISLFISVAWSKIRNIYHLLQLWRQFATTIRF